MITKTDLLNPAKYDRSIPELEDFLLHSVFVAGKKAKEQSEKLQFLYQYVDADAKSPFEGISRWSKDHLNVCLREIRSGQYNRLTNCIYELCKSGINLQTCTCEDLEKFPGIGFKTSRFFIVYSRPITNCAILDTHILAWLREKHPDAPFSTPTSKTQYTKWENIFLQHCEELNKTPQELDFEIWVARQKSWKV